MSGAWGVPLPRDVVRAGGPDTLTYLQGQLSQDLAALGVGDSAHSLLLTPQGHLVALLRVTRTGEDEVVIDTDPGTGEAVLARLQQFLLRTACQLDVVDWACVAVRGEGATPPAGDDVPDGVHVVVPDTPGLGYDLLGPGATVPTGVELGDEADYEALRIEQGVPRAGSELTERTIPAEVGVVDRAASFTKGCYTGQELVARIDSRGGNVPRRLRGVIVDGDVAPPPGAVVWVDGGEVGAVTSSATSPSLGAPVALAMVKRGTDVPGLCTIRWAGSTPEGGRADARLAEVPLDRSDPAPPVSS